MSGNTQPQQRRSLRQRSSRRRSSQRRSRTAAILASASVLLSVISGIQVWEYGRSHQWWGETEALRHLKSSQVGTDPLLSYERIHQEQSQPVGFLGKATSNWYSAWYDPGADSPSQAQGRIVEFALQHGFAIREALGTSPVSTYLVSDDGVSLVIGVETEEDFPAPAGEPIDTVVVRLSYL